MFATHLIGQSGKLFFGHPLDIDKVAVERERGVRDWMVPSVYLIDRVFFIFLDFSLWPSQLSGWKLFHLLMNNICKLRSEIKIFITGGLHGDGGGRVQCGAVQSAGDRQTLSQLDGDHSCLHLHSDCPPYLYIVRLSQPALLFIRNISGFW